MNNNKDGANAPSIDHAKGDTIFDTGGGKFLDLNMGYGAIWLGHGNTAITCAMTTQLKKYSAPGYLPTEALETANTRLDALLPDSHETRGIYSTGTEAVEVALRLACAETGHHHFGAVAGSMHGNSFLTSALGSTSAISAADRTHRFPSFAALDLNQFEQEFVSLVRTTPIAAFVVEPVQMTGGGYQAPDGFYDLLFGLCELHGVLTIFDETLTGLYRCGNRFYLDKTGHTPDILLIGKGIANGFPASVVVARKGMSHNRALIRPGSTFLNHPVACSAIAATLSELDRIQPRRKVIEIENTITAALGRLEIRGCGAMWCLGLSDAESLGQFASRLKDQGIMVSYYDRFIRLLPALTIRLSALQDACERIRDTHADNIT